MTTGRIASYIHSDKTTPAKAGCLVRVTSDTDFAAHTAEFSAFADKAAKFCYAAQAGAWSDVAAMFPDLEAERVTLAASLKENIAIDQIAMLAL